MSKLSFSGQIVLFYIRKDLPEIYHCKLSAVFNEYYQLESQWKYEVRKP